MLPMKLSDYFESQGRGAALRLAKDIAAFSSDMSSWTIGKRPVPAERCIAIEQATAGLVRCEDLRPDVAWFVLRGTPGQTPCAPTPADAQPATPAFQNLESGVA